MVHRLAAVSKACTSGTTRPSDDLVGVWAAERELSAVLSLDSTSAMSRQFTLGGADYLDPFCAERRLYRFTHAYEQQTFCG